MTNHEFTKTLGRVLVRPTIFPVPGIGARVAFGEMAGPLLLASTRVAPLKLKETGYRFEHAKLEDALLHAARQRFRPIFLTSLTTFLGISPLIFERSIQAQFLAPTAVSLGFGILFATLLIMIVVPALAVQEDRIVRWFKSRRVPVVNAPTPVEALVPAGD